MSEWHEQKEIISWFKAAYPEHVLALRIGMGGLNLGGSKRAAMMNSQMKAQGMVKGEADIVVLIPKGNYGALVLEHKAIGSAHKLTVEQKEYLEYHESVGNCTVSTRGVEAGKAAIKTYMEQ